MADPRLADDYQSGDEMNDEILADALPKTALQEDLALSDSDVSDSEEDDDTPSSSSNGHVSEKENESEGEENESEEEKTDSDEELDSMILTAINEPSDDSPSPKAPSVPSSERAPKRQKKEKQEKPSAKNDRPAPGTITRGYVSQDRIFACNMIGLDPNNLIMPTKKLPYVPRKDPATAEAKAARMAAIREEKRLADERRNAAMARALAKKEEREAYRPPLKRPSEAGCPVPQKVQKAKMSDSSTASDAKENGRPMASTEDKQIVFREKAGPCPPGQTYVGTVMVIISNKSKPSSAPSSIAGKSHSVSTAGSGAESQDGNTTSNASIDPAKKPKKPRDQCGKCRKRIKPDPDFISCCGCERLFHRACLDSVPDMVSPPWQCQRCVAESQKKQKRRRNSAPKPKGLQIC
uniref:PHD-type domain-containing protein n=1 Tax=Panagrellus redivivus TaxID=6233 RepID=A0A7E4W6X6_PANRE